MDQVTNTYPMEPLKLEGAAKALGFSWRTLHDRLKTWGERYPQVELFELDGRTKLFYPEHIQNCTKVRAWLAQDQSSTRKPGGTKSISTRHRDAAFAEALELATTKSPGKRPRRRTVKSAEVISLPRRNEGSSLRPQPPR